jgi:hypothetical protein
MKVRELVELLRKLPNQEATILIGEGMTPNVWLTVCGVAERNISLANDNPDRVGPGSELDVDTT